MINFQIDYMNISLQFYTRYKTTTLQHAKISKYMSQKGLFTPYFKTEHQNLAK